jgi:hypothetical protein
MLKTSVCLLEKDRSRENGCAEEAVNGTALTTEEKRGLVKKLIMYRKIAEERNDTNTCTVVAR